MHSLSIPPHKDTIISGDTDPVDTINNWAEKSIKRLLALDFDKSSIIIDPDIGFGKYLYQNISILPNIEALQNFGCKVLVVILGSHLFLPFLQNLSLIKI
ncbi:dihydropteroate synthase [Wolbachia endosymbiont of Wuchereria bancrofti]|uniref:dihydropteroate synthase n=1 Tax=Wolbachia endosymbiont of Wuchereria bancrofti TaxID=96496 RepID=UPI0003467535|nr:dihydropteroate synthase [Wolbachia endosymbiont of Wuchereria bancrofti]OWZ25282.1 pterin binding enzyme family protein [Wolbachia endosymbiont of Wuchereria bancrofti]